MHTEPNISAPSASHLIGMVAAGLGAGILDIEARGLGVVARLDLDGETYRIQLDRLPGVDRR